MKLWWTVVQALGLFRACSSDDVILHVLHTCPVQGQLRVSLNNASKSVGEYKTHLQVHSQNRLGR